MYVDTMSLQFDAPPIFTHSIERKARELDFFVSNLHLLFFFYIKIWHSSKIKTHGIEIQIKNIVLDAKKERKKNDEILGRIAGNSEFQVGNQ